MAYHRERQTFGSLMTVVPVSVASLPVSAPDGSIAPVTDDPLHPVYTRYGGAWLPLAGGDSVAESQGSIIVSVDTNGDDGPLPNRPARIVSGDYSAIPFASQDGAFAALPSIMRDNHTLTIRYSNEFHAKARISSRAFGVEASGGGLTIEPITPGTKPVIDELVLRGCTGDVTFNSIEINTFSCNGMFGVTFIDTDIVQRALLDNVGRPTLMTNVTNAGLLMINGSSQTLNISGLINSGQVLLANVGSGGAGVQITNLTGGWVDIHNSVITSLSLTSTGSPGGSSPLVVTHSTILSLEADISGSVGDAIRLQSNAVVEAARLVGSGNGGYGVNFVGAHSCIRLTPGAITGLNGSLGDILFQDAALTALWSDLAMSGNAEVDTIAGNRAFRSDM